MKFDFKLALNHLAVSRISLKIAKACTKQDTDIYLTSEEYHELINLASGDGNLPDKPEEKGQVVLHVDLASEYVENANNKIKSLREIKDIIE